MEIDILKLLRGGVPRSDREWHQCSAWLKSLGWIDNGSHWIDHTTGDEIPIESALSRAARSEATRMLVARGYRVDALGWVYPADTYTMPDGEVVPVEPYKGKPFTLAYAFRAERLHIR